MNIFIIGGTGFISGHLVEMLLDAGHRVSVFTRGKSGGSARRRENLTFLIGDRRNENSLRDVVSADNFDAVFDLVAYKRQDSEIAAGIFRGKVGRFIHCSTISVYMVSNDVQCPITEEQANAPLMPFFERNPFGMHYGIDKRQCEAVLWQAHDVSEFPVSMLRPTYVCGPHDPTLRDFFWIERIRDGGPLLIPGSGDFAFQNVFVDDVARAFVSLLDHPASIGQAYNVVGEEIYSLNDYLQMLCDLLDRQPEFVHVDQEAFDGQPLGSHPRGDVFPFNTRRTAIFSLEKIKRDLYYRSTPIRDWLPRTVQWYLEKFSGHSTGFERRKDELDFIQKWQMKRQDLSPVLRNERTEGKA
jgi:nucleoside-diphosphate-sugar epimerase